MIDARRQCGPTQYARICGGRPRPIHSLTPACSNQRAPTAYQRARRKLRSVLKR